MREIDAKVDELNGSEKLMELFWTQQDEIELQADIAFEKGEAQGEARYNELVAALIAADRLEDLKRITVDPAYREELFAELAIA